MSRIVALPIAMAILLLATLASPAILAQEGYTLTITVVGVDNKPLSGVTVYLYDVNGTERSATTDTNGVATFTGLANGTYLVVVKASYVVISTVNVAGATSAIINASAMHYANLTSTPIAVTVSVVPGNGFELVSLDLGTNVTVYSSVPINVTYPKEVTKLPFKYILDKIKFDTTETNSTTIALDMSKDFNVVAYYTKTFAVTLNMWMVLILVLILVIAIVVALKAGSKTAASMIAEYVARNRKFVRKRW